MILRHAEYMLYALPGVETPTTNGFVCVVDLFCAYMVEMDIIYLESRVIKRFVPSPAANPLRTL